MGVGGLARDGVREAGDDLVVGGESRYLRVCSRRPREQVVQSFKGLRGVSGGIHRAAPSLAGVGELGRGGGELDEFFGRTGEVELELAQPVALGAQRGIVLADAAVQRDAGCGVAECAGRFGDIGEVGRGDPRVAVGGGILRGGRTCSGIGVRVAERLREAAALGRILDAGGDGREVPAGGVNRGPRRGGLRVEPGERLPGGGQFDGERVMFGFGRGRRLDQLLTPGREAVACGGGLPRGRDRVLGGRVGRLQCGDTVAPRSRGRVGVGRARGAGTIGCGALTLGGLVAYSAPPRPGRRR